jgi:beta-galactosidase
MINCIKNSVKRFSLLLLFVFISYGQALFAQQSKRLNQDWEFYKNDLGGVWEAMRPAKEGSSESVPLWTKVNLPHSFNAEDAVDPDQNYYQGPGWYRTSLNIDNPYKNGRILLHFEGSGQKTSVYVYNTKVGEHVGGYDEWTVDITDAVAAFKKEKAYTDQYNNKIPLAIRCDNSRDLEMIPSDLSDFNVYGGIYRYLNLVYTPQVSIDKIFALAETDVKGKQGTLKITGRLYNPTGVDTAVVKVVVKDPNGKQVYTANKQMKAFYGDKELWNITINKPILWSTDAPNLYTVEVSISAKGQTYSHVEKIGFRHFEFVKKGPFMLNGKRLLLRGTHRHEDHAGVAAAMTEDMMRTEIQMMKDMGVNFIRLGHYQQSRIILDLCDSLGILVWEEIPWCRGGLGGDVYKNQARRMLTNMIEQHYNHPSVIIWGLGNENDWPGDFTTFDEHLIREFMKELNDLSHKLDNTRKTAIRRCDFCKDIVDVYSPSIWAGWYRGVYTEYKESSKREFDRVDNFLHVEWGGDSHARRHAESPDGNLSKIKKGDGADERAGDASLYGGGARVSKDGDWSESYMSNLIDWHLKEQETMPWLSGTAYWPFKDFSTPVRPENPVPYMNQKGVIERDFTKKEAYYIFQSYWTDKPMVHIYGHSWPIRWGNANESKMVKVYSNAEEAELFVNGISQGKRKRNSQDFPAAGLRWNVIYKEGENNIKVVAKKGKTVITDEITQSYQTAKWGKPSQILIKKIAEDTQKVTVEVQLADDNGVFCLDSREYINFNLAGDGKLIDNQGTSTGSRRVQAFNGRAIISVEKNNGKSVISALSEGSKSVFLEL